jgi:hypothetical protein
MRKTSKLRLRWRFLLITLYGGAVTAQQSAPTTVILNHHPQPSQITACLPDTDLTKYHIAKITVEDPFDFLRWIGLKRKGIEAQLQAKYVGQPFSVDVLHDSLKAIEEARFTLNNEMSFSIRVEFAYVQNCKTNPNTLEVIYRIYSTDPPKFMGGATEAQRNVETSPETTTGLKRTASPFYFHPTGGYNRSDGFFGGGRIDVRPKPGRFRLLDGFTAKGDGSYARRYLAAGLHGSIVNHAWIQSLEWQLSYRNSSLPADGLRLSQADLTGQLSGASRPFWKGTVLARFGGVLQGGNMQSLAPGGMLAPQTVANAAVGSAKGYIGLSSRTTHNVLSASYGLELGSIGPSTQIDWRKHVGDVVEEFWFPIGDHKPLEVETRFTAGGIQVPHAIPLAARFFGGSNDDSFIPGDSWQIRGVPTIRAIPARRFYLTGAGAGGDRFTSVNLTVSYPVKTHPMIPKELTDDKEFNDLLAGQIISAASVEQNYYASKDSHFTAAWNRLPKINELLKNLQAAVDRMQASHPGQFSDEFTECTTDIGALQVEINSALGVKVSKQYDGLSSVVSDLQEPIDGCVGTGSLNEQLKDPGITAAATEISDAQTGLVKDFSAIDQAAAKQKASNDIAFVNRTIKTLLREFNVYSIAPVAIFDAASIGPAKGKFGGTRIGPGGGIRLEIASYVNFTLGYAWNVNRQPGEGQGALFFNIGVRDLFH